MFKKYVYIYIYFFFNIFIYTREIKEKIIFTLLLSSVSNSMLLTVGIYLSMLYILFYIILIILIIILIISLRTI